MSTNAATVAAQTKKGHAPIWLIGGGGLLLVVWLIGNSVQIQTSEVWILARFTNVNVLGGFSVYGQLGILFSGTLTPQQVVSYMFAYIVQASYMFCAIEMDLPENRRSKILWAAVGFLVVLNTAGDFNYASQAGFNVWGQLGFAVAMFAGSFGFGMAGASILSKGIKQLGA